MNEPGTITCQWKKLVIIGGDNKGMCWGLSGIKFRQQAGQGSRTGQALKVSLTLTVHTKAAIIIEVCRVAQTFLLITTVY